MNNKWIILLFIIFLNFLGTSIPYPIFAPLFLHPVQGGLVSLHLSSTMQRCFLGIALAAYPFGQFFGAPITGGFSDQLGRKKVLVAILFCAAVGYVLTAYAIQNSFLPLLLIGRFITGFFETGFIIVQAYLVDLKIEKHKGFGSISSIAALGSLIGPLISGVLSNKSIVHWFNYSTPFYFAILPTIFSAIIILFTIPEIKNENNSLREKWFQRLNVYKSYTRAIKNNQVKWLLISGIFLYLGIDTLYEFYPALLVLRWHFISTQISRVMLVLFIGLSIGSFFLSKAISGRLKVDYSIYIITCTFLVIYSCFLLTDKASFLYFQFIFIGLTIGIINTHYVVLISNSVSKLEQGEIMGVRFGLRTLGDALTSIFGGFCLVFSIYFPMLLVIALFIIFLYMFYYVRKNKYNHCPINTAHINSNAISLDKA